MTKYGVFKNTTITIDTSMLKTTKRAGGLIINFKNRDAFEFNGQVYSNLLLNQLFNEFPMLSLEQIVGGNPINLKPELVSNLYESRELCMAVMDTAYRNRMQKHLIYIQNEPPFSEVATTNNEYYVDEVDDV